MAKGFHAELNNNINFSDDVLQIYFSMKNI